MSLPILQPRDGAIAYQPIWAKLTAYDGSRFWAWTEQLITSSGPINKLGGSYGTITANPAEEVNDLLAAVDDVVIVYKSFFNPTVGWVHEFVNAMVPPVGQSLVGIIILEDQKSAGTAGGSSTAASWLKRTINTIKTDTGSLVSSLSANVFTLLPGNYFIKARSSAHDGGAHQIRLNNTTDTDLTYGSSAYAGGTVRQTDSFVTKWVELTVPTAFQIDHWFQTACATYGMGASSTTGQINVYTQVEILCFEAGGGGGGGGGLTSVGLVNALDDTVTISGSPLTANGDITLTAVDAGAADALVGWDDSAGKKIYFALGASLATTTTTVHVSEGDKGDITTSGGAGNVWTIDDDVVTFAKIQNISTDRILGRDTVGTGDVEQLLLGGGLEFSGAGDIYLSAFTGDATKPLASTVLTVVKASGTFSLPGDISPSQITGSENNYNPTGTSTASTLRINSISALNITGLLAGLDGELKILHNIGAFTITLVDESAFSTAANRFALSNDYRLLADQSVQLQYDATSARWRILAPIVTVITSPATATALGPKLTFVGTGIAITAAADTVTFVGSLPGSIYYPTPITGDTNNYNPGTLNSPITTAYLSSDTAWKITGIVYPGSACGYIVIFHNNGSYPILFPSQSTDSTAGNRLLSSEDMVIKPNESIAYQYDCTALRWRLLWRTTCCFEAFTLTREVDYNFVPDFTGWIEIYGHGAGGIGGGNVDAGGGGGGGAYCKLNAYYVTAGVTYGMTVGIGNTLFIDAAVTVYSAAKGTDGTDGVDDGGAGGLASACIGTTKTNGTDGNDHVGDAGGNGGAAASPDGGAGGAGGSGIGIDGAVGIVPGGGGGGGGNNGGAQGQGANGRLTIRRIA